MNRPLAGIKESFPKRKKLKNFSCGDFPRKMNSILNKEKDKMKLLKSLFIGTLCGCLLAIGVVPVSFAQEKVTIKFWSIMTGLAGKATEAIVADFNRTHPAIKVELTRVPTIDVTDISKLMAAIAGGTGPDVYFLDRFTAAPRANQGILKPLDPYFKEYGWENPKDDYLDFAWNEAQWQGKTYALPMDTDVRCLFYREEHFLEAGLDPEKPPKTTVELAAYADKLTKYDSKGNLIRIGFVPWLSQGSVYSWSVIYGGQWIDVENQKILANDPVNVKALTEQHKRYIDKYPGIMKFVAGFGGGITDAMVSGQVSMTLNCHSYIVFLEKFAPEEKFRTAYLPRPPELADEPISWSGGFSLTVPMGARHPKEAFEFMRYFTGYEGQMMYARIYGAMPTHLEALEAHIRESDPQMRSLLEYVKFSVCRPPCPAWSLMWPEQHAVRDYIIHGRKSPQEALDDLTVRIQDELDTILGR